ncbi:IPExxxVDY family protein [Hyunsoonleella flava]|uniref:IPExxxVDY family protein n=1 Tax=Hyunsoonleella flava TaxID=2527939 RepID=A0A4Q9FD70_9FLAO|nr:IPExxxVDY family protein [Hyunsoonleella flava]TBN02465.1 IPExxxVDY family protein [Hyunsoonleella flava]
MAVHKLILDDIFEDVSCTLIAIHCAIEDYRLAYLLNKYLDITLTRKPKDLDFNNGVTEYSVFEYEDENKLDTWHLVSNICKIETESKIEQQSLFNAHHKVIRTYNLVPEYGKVNYFLKIDNEFSNSKEKQIINNLLKIPQIAMAYNVDMSALKSKEHLIFD